VSRSPYAHSKSRNRPSRPPKPTGPARPARQSATVAKPRASDRAASSKGPRSGRSARSATAPKAQNAKTSRAIKSTKAPKATTRLGLAGRTPKARRRSPDTGRNVTSTRPRSSARAQKAPIDSPPSHARRRRAPVVVAAVFAVVVLATSFPVAGLLSQHRQLSAAAAQLSQLRHSNRSLAQQQQQLDSKAYIQQLAREDYQLVLPGHTLYDVLPPGGHTAASTPGARTGGDPGNQPLVAPANAPNLSPDPNLSPPPAATGGNNATAPKAGGSAATGSGGHPGPTTFWSRVGDSLEFWK
jgi:cell division protein FtsB